MLELCKWYIGNINLCEIMDDETNCFGEIHQCECERLRQQELHAEAIDYKADADMED